jgi:hypothetical protein
VLIRFGGVGPGSCCSLHWGEVTFDDAAGSLYLPLSDDVYFIDRQPLGFERGRNGEGHSSSQITP